MTFQTTLVEAFCLVGLGLYTLSGLALYNAWEKLNLRLDNPGKTRNQLSLERQVQSSKRVQEEWAASHDETP